MSDDAKPDTSTEEVLRQAQVLEEGAIMWRDDAATIEAGILDPTTMHASDCTRLANGLSDAAALLRTLLAALREAGHE